MGKRHPNPRLVKLHRSYTVEQIARLFDIHKNTVRAWVKQGLQPIDGLRPALFHGPVLVAFLLRRPSPQSNPICQAISIVCHAERQKHRPETWRNLCR
jgi:transposase-like protein